jgi:RHS repeat-associated protein
MLQLYKKFWLNVNLKILLTSLVTVSTVTQLPAPPVPVADVVLDSQVNAAIQVTATHSIALNPGFSVNGANGTFNAAIVAIPIPNCVQLSASPSQDQNYITTFTPQIAISDAVSLPSRNTCEVMEAIQYFDGLGRPIQTVQVKGNNDATKDIIQPIAYDEFGRENKKYLPYADGTGTTGSYRSDALQAGAGQSNFYAPTPPSGVTTINTPFAETVLEPSPLNRVVEQGAPGDDWQITAGHTIKTVYDANIANDVQQYDAVPVTTPGAEYQRTLVPLGYYNAGELYLTVTKNENWVSTDGKTHTTEEYKDKEGRLILKRAFDTGGIALSTYYVYDDRGNLSFVLPPGANPDGGSISPALLDNFCYQYRYDGRSRLIEKRVPSKDGWEYMVYNPHDQLVMSQDAMQHQNNKWLFTKYDELGRAIMTGIFSSTDSRTTQQSNVNIQTDFGETSDNTTTTGYSNNTFPIANIDNYLTIVYYDNYTFPGTSTVAAANAYLNTGQSLATGSKVLTTDGTASYLSASYYDDEGRPTETVSQNNLGGIDRVVNSYSFTGEVLSSTRTHTVGSQTTTITANYVYDHMGRKVQTNESINGAPPIILSRVDYNDIGQPHIKHLHSEDNGTSFLQDITYSYNVRGWLRTANTTNNLFNLDLRYNKDLDPGVTPQFNGNIAAMLYTGTYSGSKQFNYAYDPLNRLINAQSTGGTLDETITYDNMGNISTLIRGGTNNAAALSYNYTDIHGNPGNRLTAVNHTSDGSPFRTYTYDDNGNATTDGNLTTSAKTINYNILNLPQSVTSNGTTLATYTYDATGTKLNNTSNTGDGSWDYVSGIVYHTDNSGVRSIAYIQTEEGRAVPNGSGYRYVYDLKDLLGNVRVSFDKNNSTDLVEVVQENEYYAFGLTEKLYDNSNDNRYLYNGKEIQTDLVSQYDYGARFYDPVIARWTSVDPLAEKSRRWSPYNYVMNNPLRNSDPDGMSEQDELNDFIGSMPAPDQNEHTKNGEQSATTTTSTTTGNGTNETGSNEGKESIYVNTLGQAVAVVAEPKGPKPLPKPKDLGTLPEVDIVGHTDITNQGGINIYRVWETDQSTVDRFSTGSGLNGYILERPGPSTTQSGQRLRIPAGTYNLMKSPGTAKDIKLHAEWELYNDQVSDSRHILFHLGNYPRNTDGCLLVGSSRDVDFVGGNSTKATDALNNYINSFNGNVVVNIYDPPKP